jgi:hypothetical protein
MFNSVAMIFTGNSGSANINNNLSMVHIPLGFRPAAATTINTGTGNVPNNQYTIDVFTTGTNVFTSGGLNVTTGNTEWTMRTPAVLGIPANTAISLTNMAWETADPMPT